MQLIGNNLIDHVPQTRTTPARSILPSTVVAGARPCVRGKFIFVGDEKLYIRGVTYGPFRPDERGSEYHTPDIVSQDFAQMAANGINTIRTYTVPPRWLLDIAQQHGLRVMVGLPWEQHITFLDGKKGAQSIEQRVRAGVQACAGHPAILCYAIGNEIPAPIVRWYGPRRVERFLERLYLAAKDEDPDGLVTYVNYPTTEYLELPFLDFVCFNVYLESQERLDAYLARLQNLAGDKPLLMAEIGLDSRRNGEEIQARVLDWQIRTVFAAGCTGTFVFAWTDEWHRGGYDIEDWDFGLTSRDRSPKLALQAVRDAFVEVPFPPDLPWPRISVVVCTYNGSRTMPDCCEGLLDLEYPNFEVIIVDDGSVDAVASVAREYGFHVISTPNRGLSSARNTGLEAATGEIVAYIDDDARPDPQWLTYLAATFMSTKHAGVGGPNITPPGDGPIAGCVANSPGNPTHILLSDQEAEHIPGCNMAFRKAALQAIGGFDPRFRIAGDDVDVCWRLQQAGLSLGFSPSAMVWHHRRNSVKAYWKQQLNYGRAEGLLEMKWAEKYNTFGHLDWQGKLYGNGPGRISLLGRQRIYYGVWGSRLFQSIYETSPGTLLSLTLMPEWYLVILGLVALSAFGVLGSPVPITLPLLGLAVGPPVAQGILSAAHASFPTEPRSRREQLKLQSLTALLHIVQPLARLRGRLSYGLTPWRRRGAPQYAFPRPQTSTIWSERWQALEKRLEAIEAVLREQGVVVMRGGDFDRWDLEVRGGLFGVLRTRMAIEEHGGGKQLVRIRLWPRFSALGLGLTFVCAVLSALEAIDQEWLAAAIMGTIAILLAIRAFGDCAAAMASYLHGLKHPRIMGE
jgi:GT2 family glycosyltransferase